MVSIADKSGVEGEHAMDVDLEQTGELAVAVEPHQVAWLREAAAAGGGTFLDEAAVRAEVASPTYLAGLFSPDCALLHPAKMVHELARVATELGVEIHEGSPVTGLSAERGGGPVTVSTAACIARSPDASVTASRVCSSRCRSTRRLSTCHSWSAVG